MTEHMLTAEDLLTGSRAIHEVMIPPAVLTPGRDAESDAPHACVRLRPLSVGLLTLISRAARDDASLAPLLMIKEAMLEPTLSLDHIRQMHVGLVYYLVSQINRISGLDADGSALDGAVDTPLGRMHILLAKHFGWTPEQVSQLTPGQVAVYLAGIERLLQLEKGNA
jgi:hypothetical protein